MFYYAIDLLRLYKCTRNSLKTRVIQFAASMSTTRISLLAAALVLVFGVCDLHSLESVERLPKGTRFPSGFLFGAATAAFQVEGAWNADGKGPSIWDELMHERPDLFAGNISADVGADSYHQFDQDIAALRETGVSVKYSSWGRLPN